MIYIYIYVYIYIDVYIYICVLIYIYILLLKDSALKGSERVKDINFGLVEPDGTWMFHMIFLCFVDGSSLQWPALWLQLTEFFSAQAGEHPVFLSDQLRSC